ncbi:thermonuclease family protein [Paenibacillus sp. JX-17]|uniref:Thermonuclease family protein n=1 Tax=Paenibacillus lacisoli TaxID=3064525 RepID=A0ABT9CDE5_9BACL|nr:thermonuclease family protein [Paenibacillus sp. JX-17]MDO7907290.1 thermonuclease family protein [Paenibacillus sp. JX-17]
MNNSNRPLIGTPNLWMILLLLTALLLTAAGCSSESAQKTGSPSASQTNGTAVTLDRAIDGDTLRVFYQGKSELVRLLLVDTPETAHPQLGEQPYGREAKAYTRKLLEQAHDITLEFDDGPHRDKYNRLLAYVYLDGTMLQKSLLKDSMARVAYIYPPNDRYADEFKTIENSAKKQRLGIWKYDNYARQDGFHPESFKSSTSSTKSSTSGTKGPSDAKPSNTCSIKGNIKANGERIYHTTASPAYAQVKPEQWFCSEQAAKAAGFRAAGQ